MNDRFTLRKGDVRRSFERAAGSYDKAAGLAREVAERMLERLDLLRATPLRILDLGSGTGYGARKLRRRYGNCAVVELDFAIGMLLRSREHAPWWRRRLDALTGTYDCQVCADMERLPFADSSFDMVWSNLALNWTVSPTQVFAETWRVLRPGGVWMFSTLGPDTLKELRGAYAGVDQYVRVNRFDDMHDLGDLLVGSRFAAPVMDMECITLTYLDVRVLLRELKASGSQNLNSGRNLALSGKKAFAAGIEAYERLRTDDRLPATFEIVYGHAWKPERELVRTDGRAVVHFHDTPPRSAL